MLMGAINGVGMPAGAMNSLVRRGGQSPGGLGRMCAVTGMCWRTATTFPSVLVLALLIGLFAAPQTASAQLVGKLVGNTGQDSVADTSTETMGHAQAFTTGSTTAGYRLTRVDLKFEISGTGGNPDFTVQIHEDSSGAPGDSLATLTRAAALTTGINQYNVSGGGLSLNANTTYHVVTHVSAWTGRNAVRVRATASDDEDDGAVTGWTIADKGRHRPAAGGSWTESDNSRQIAVYGRERETVPPELSAATVNGTLLVLAYDELLNTTAPAASDFTLTVDGTAATVSSVTVSGTSVRLTLASAVTSGQAVLVSYTVPSANPIQDVDGNQAAGFTDEAVTYDTTGPSVIDATVRGTELTLTYSEPLDQTTQLRTVDFALKVDGSSVDAAAVRRSGDTMIVVTLPVTVETADQTVQFWYPQDLSQYHLKDLHGNKAVLIFANDPVYATVVDVTAPVLSAATVDGTRLTLAYNEPLDPTSVPDTSDFTVTVATAAATVSSVDVTGRAVVLTLATAVTTGQSVSVSYTVPSSNPIRDFAENVAAALPTQTVNEVSADATLSALSVTEADGTALTLDPAFSSSSHAYGVRVADGGSSAKVTATVSGTGAMLSAYLDRARPGVDEAITITSGTEVELTHLQAGPNVLTLTVTAPDGVAKQEYELTVIVPGPPSVFIHPRGNVTIGAGTDYPMSVESLSETPTPDPDGGEVTYEWTVTDSNGDTITSNVLLETDTLTATTRAVTFNASTPGVYTVEMVATDDEDETGTDIRVLTVTESTPPSLTGAEAVSSTALVLTYDEALDTTSVPAVGDFTVSVNDATGVNPSAVAVEGSKVTLTPASALTISDTVTVSYTVGTNPIRDLASNDAAAFTGQAVSVDVTALALSTAEAEGTEIELTFNRALDTTSVPAVTAFTVTVGGGTGSNPSSVAVEGSKVTLTLASELVFGSAVTVAYTVPDANPIRDRFGNGVAAFSETTTVVDTKPPTIRGFNSSNYSQDTYGEDYEVFLRFSEPLDETSVPDIGDFSVQWPVGTALTLHSVVVSGSTVLLTVTSRMDAGGSGSTAKVAYTAGTNPIRDPSGNVTPYTGGNITVADTKKPFLESAVVDGTAVWLTFNERLTDRNYDSVVSSFGVKVDGTAVSVTGVERDLTNQAISPRRVKVTLAAPVSSADRTVTVSYSPPSGISSTYRIADRLLNYADGFSDHPATVRDTTAPAFQSAAAAGTGMTLTYDEFLNTNSVPDEGDFSVTIDSGTPVNPSSVAIAGKTVVLALSSAVSSGQTVTVSYTVPTGVGANPIQDRSGNSAAALADEDVTVTDDTTAPAFQSATAEATELTLTYDEALDAASVPDASAYTVTVGGSAVGLAATDPVAVSGLAVTLTLASAVSLDQTVTVSYAVPGTDPIQDPSGNDAVALTDQAVTVVDTAAPVLVAATMGDSGLRLIRLTYDETLDDGSVPSATAFGVKVDSGNAANPSSVAVEGAVVTLTLASPVRAVQTVTVSYIVPGSNPIRDPSENGAAALTDRPVTVSDTTAPALVPSTAAVPNPVVMGTALSLTYDEALVATPVPAASAFTVKVDGNRVNLAADSPVSIVGSAVTLTLAEAVLSADREVTVSYAVPGTNPIRDASGNVAAALTDETVAVTDDTPPTLEPPTVLGAMITLDFDEMLDPDSVPAPSAFTVKVTQGGTTSSGLAATGPMSIAAVTSDGTPPNVTGVQISGSAVVLTLDREVMPGDAVTVSYTKPATNPLRDGAGNEVASFGDRTVFSSVATLSGLVVEDGDGTGLALDPVFTSGVTTYAVTAGPAVTLARVTATLTDGRAKLSSSLARPGESPEALDMISGTATEPFDLKAGDNVLTITVTAEDLDTTQSYILTVMREPAGTGPLKAWLARFGRTAAEHALDGIAGRMRASRAAGFRGELGGLPPTSVSSSGSGFDRYDRVRETQDATVGEMLLGSSFSMTGEADGSGGSLAYWGRGAQSRFEGRDGDLSVEGEVTTGMVGADYARDRWTLGLTLMHSDGDGSFSGGESSEGGRIGATLTAVVPWSSWQATERLDFWGAAGRGGGKATLTPEGGEAVRSDIGWSMAALGMRNELISPADAGYAAGTGPSLSLNTDALWVRTTSGASGELAATASEVSRLRVGLEGEWRIGLENGGRLVPHMEIGVRQDDGEAETGTGFELGGGLIWQDPELGLSMELEGRTLLAHDAEGRKESGYAVSMVYDPAPATARGASFSLRQDWGDGVNGGVDTLFSSGPMPSVGGSGSSSGRWDAEAAYGIPAFGGDFTSSPHVGFGQSDGGQDYSLGWRVTPEGSGAPDVSVGLETTRRERAGAAAKHGIGIGVSANW